MSPDDTLLSKSKTIRLAIAGIIIVLLIHVVIFMLPVPQTIGLGLKYGFLSVIVFGIFYCFFGLYFNKYIIIINLAFILLLFALTLTGLWNSGLSINYTIGGFLPARADHFHYYIDAKKLLAGGLLSEFSSNRPLFPAYLAFLLSVTHQNLQLTLILLTLITGLCSFILMCEVQKSNGWMAGLILFSVIFLYYRNLIGLMMTEPLGLALGLLALALLWRGTRVQNTIIIIFGIFLLVSALNARAGAFIILPMIIFWGIGVLYREQSNHIFRFLTGSTVIVFAGFALNYFVFKQVGSAQGIPFANFAHILYGLVTGTYWGQVFIDYPELNLTNFDQETVKQIYILTFQQFLNSPWTLVFNLFDKWLSYLLPTSDGIFTFIQPHYAAETVLAYAVRLFFYTLSIIGLFYCWKHRNNHFYSLVLFSNIGIWLSVPFLTDMGRTAAATIPFVAALACCGVVGIPDLNRNIQKWLSLLAPVPRSAESSGLHSVLLYGVSVGLAGVLYCYPFFLQRHQPALLTVMEKSCEHDKEAVYVKLTSGSGLHLVDDDFVKQTKIPFVRISDFLHGITYAEEPWFFDYFLNIKTGMSIITTFNLIQQSQQFHLIIKSSLLPDDKGIVGICGKQYGPVFVASSLFTIPVFSSPAK